MRIEGRLTKWNDDRGFGFITPIEGGGEIFVHISAFPRDGRRPALGEYLSFEIEIDSTGKKRATHLLCPSRSAAQPLRRPSVPRDKETPALLTRFWPAVVLIVIVIAAYLSGQSSRRAIPQSAVVPPTINETDTRTSDDAATSPFHCDGRTRCSQMTSCDEAKFFLRNCPNVEMDGDQDGVPCERQWCGGF